ncbi:NADP-specific glutamate dehydrogenase [Pseudopedobacter sp.]|uniref:NADP-specific glutamate dehydrogenase n=1 Tax=Pseudopedobacter sp. TaxID=1936787 RepID=UPI00334182C5
MLENNNSLNIIKARNASEPEFLQAVTEVAESVLPYIEKHPIYKNNKIFERIAEPERVIMFRVPWVDDKGEIQVNRGYRIQMNSAIGPYKGGLRFHPSVTLSVLKFLAFEQVFKNSLTGLPMGGGKGGSDFDPKGKSDNEVMRFCQSFMTELSRHIGANLDVPAGDIGVGKREIGYLFGQYKRLQNEFTGVLTGKSIEWGGSQIRPEATGYGLVYFVEEIFKTQGKSLLGKTVVISGSGNVAQFAAEKCIQQGAKVLTMSDSAGYIYDPEGIDLAKLEYIKNLKDNLRGRIKQYTNDYPQAQYFEGEKPWGIKCDIALPNATQNELGGEDAAKLIANGCFCVAEGANMPCTPEAVQAFNTAKVFYAPGKAANAGGVAVSGLEMAQNSLRYNWSRDKVDAKLKEIMHDIHAICVKYGTEEDGHVNYEKGANIGGFVKVADAMIAQGVV